MPRRTGLSSPRPAPSAWRAGLLGATHLRTRAGGAQPRHFKRPGPQMPLYFMGAIDALYPLGPIFHGAGLNITVLSNNGIVHVGIIACPEGIPDPGTPRRLLPGRAREN